jgi:hypothetical protein
LAPAYWTAGIAIGLLLILYAFITEFMTAATQRSGYSIMETSDTSTAPQSLNGLVILPFQQPIVDARFRAYGACALAETGIAAYSMQLEITFYEKGPISPFSHFISFSLVHKCIILAEAAP